MDLLGTLMGRVGDLFETCWRLVEDLLGTSCGLVGYSMGTCWGLGWDMLGTCWNLLGLVGNLLVPCWVNVGDSMVTCL